MGCGASVEKKDVKKVGASAKEDAVSAKDFDEVPFTQVINPKSSHINLDLPLEMKKLSIAGESYTYTASYCYVCQKGFYPDNLEKANQDSYCVLESVLGRVNTRVRCFRRAW